MHDLPAGLPTQMQSQDIEKKLANAAIPVFFSDGTVKKIKPVWKDTYRDEYTISHLPSQHIREAMTDELIFAGRLSSA